MEFFYTSIRSSKAEYGTMLRVFEYALLVFTHKISVVCHRLLRREPADVLRSEGVVAEGERLSKVAVFSEKDESIVFGSEYVRHEARVAPERAHVVFVSAVEEDGPRAVPLEKIFLCETRILVIN